MVWLSHYKLSLSLSYVILTMPNSFLFRPINEVTPGIVNNFDMKNIHSKATQYRRDQRNKDEKNKKRWKRRIGFDQNKTQQEVDSGNHLKLNPKTFDNQLRKERLVFIFIFIIIGVILCFGTKNSIISLCFFKSFKFN